VTDGQGLVEHDGFIFIRRCEARSGTRCRWVNGLGESYQGVTSLCRGARLRRSALKWPSGQTLHGEPSTARLSVACVSLDGDLSSTGRMVALFSASMGHASLTLTPLDGRTLMHLEGPNGRI